jgi:hypothetical protein
MQEFLDAFSQQAFGRTQTEAQADKVCVFCGKPATEFRDELSRKENEISGLCQKCQDEVFGGDEAA